MNSPRCHRFTACPGFESSRSHIERLNTVLGEQAENTDWQVPVAAGPGFEPAIDRKIGASFEVAGGSFVCRLSDVGSTAGFAPCWDSRHSHGGGAAIFPFFSTASFFDGIFDGMCVFAHKKFFLNQSIKGVGNNGVGVIRAV